MTNISAEQNEAIPDYLITTENDARYEVVIGEIKVKDEGKRMILKISGEYFYAVRHPRKRKD